MLVQPISQMTVEESRKYQYDVLYELQGTFDFNGDITDMKVPSQDVPGTSIQKYCLSLKYSCYKKNIIM